MKSRKPSLCIMMGLSLLISIAFASCGHKGQNRVDGFYETVTSSKSKKVELKAEPSLTIKEIQEAKTIKTSYKNQLAISVVLTADGVKKFYRLTSNNIGKTMCIVIDHKIVSNLIIQQGIKTKNLTITGDFSKTEIANMVKRLNKK